MRRTAIAAVNLSRAAKLCRKIRVYARLYLMLASFVFGFFVAIAFGGMAASRWNASIASWKSAAAVVSSNFFVDMIGMEVPEFHRSGAASSFSQTNVVKFVIRMLTDVRPWDPKSLLAREVPGLEDSMVLMQRGAVGDADAPPADYTPPAGTVGSGGAAAGAAGPAAEPGAGKADTGGSAGGADGQTGEHGTPKAGSGREAGGESPASKGGGSEAGGTTGQQGQAGSRASAAQSGSASISGSTGVSSGRKVVFIYHTHDRESFLPALKDKHITNPDDAYDPNVNVTLLGRRLAERLTDLGVGAVDSNTDYPTTVPGFNYNYSYKYSLQTLKQAKAANPDYRFYFDIHRDSGSRDQTTVKLDGVDYAQVFFIIGQLNPHWQENEQFASDIHDKLESLYPGLSRGVWAKGARSGNGEYNQSFSAHDILIEVGGPDNTLQECYRTIDILAKVIADEYRQDAKVSGSSKQ